MSAGVLYTPKDARAVAGTPSRRISGCAQWWPARIATAERLQIYARSWGWMPSTVKLTSAPRSAASVGP